jgi:hypothetical protein
MQPASESLLLGTRAAALRAVGSTLTSTLCPSTGGLPQHLGEQPPRVLGGVQLVKAETQREERIVRE